MKEIKILVDNLSEISLYIINFEHCVHAWSYTNCYLTVNTLKIWYIECPSKYVNKMPYKERNSTYSYYTKSWVRKYSKVYLNLEIVQDEFQPFAKEVT